MKIRSTSSKDIVNLGDATDLFIEWFAKTCESHFSVLHLTMLFSPHFPLCFWCIALCYTLDFFTLFHGFLQTTLLGFSNPNLVHLCILDFKQSLPLYMLLPDEEVPHTHTHTCTPSPPKKDPFMKCIST